jgi:hypothetical protein
MFHCDSLKGAGFRKATITYFAFELHGPSTKRFLFKEKIGGLQVAALFET